MHFELLYCNSFEKVCQAISRVNIWDNVQPVAVRQWIRRGKLRPIQKQGMDWLIASIAAPPTRHYISVIYEWDQIDRELYKMFPYLKGVSTVQITQNIDDFL